MSEVYQPGSDLIGTTLPNELIKFISRHFLDAKIPNPDLKEIYLTRLNFLL